MRRACGRQRWLRFHFPHRISSLLVGHWAGVRPCTHWKRGTRCCPGAFRGARVCRMSRAQLLTSCGGCRDPSTPASLLHPHPCQTRPVLQVSVSDTFTKIIARSGQGLCLQRCTECHVFVTDSWRAHSSLPSAHKLSTCSLSLSSFSYIGPIQMPSTSPPPTGVRAAIRVASCLGLMSGCLFKHLSSHSAGSTSVQGEPCVSGSCTPRCWHKVGLLNLLLLFPRKEGFGRHSADGGHVLGKAKYNCPGKLVDGTLRLRLPHFLCLSNIPLLFPKAGTWVTSEHVIGTGLPLPVFLGGA